MPQSHREAQSYNHSFFTTDLSRRDAYGTLIFTGTDITG
jgi:hypothetical protein